MYRVNKEEDRKGQLLKMAEGRAEERQSIGELARSLKKYGSTCNHVKRPPDTWELLPHAVEEGDTLQGLALKYGVSMEQLRRTNRLWASDSLYLRETLLIPVPPDTAASALTPGGVSSHDSGHSSDDSSPEEQQGAILRESSSRSSFKGNSRRGSIRASDQSDSSVTDFLGKIDSSIAHTKHQAEKIKGSSEFCTTEEFLPTGQSRRKPCVSRLRQNHGSNGSSGLEVTTQGRKLRSSLQRLENAQDEIFEL